MDPLIIFSFIILIFSVMIHEIAHGSVALSLGDPTAKDSGRLSLNPLRHLDPLGSVILPATLYIITQGRGPIFGWAKPVPINPYNFRDKKWGELKVAIAGPLTNFLIALVFGLLIRFFSLPQQLLIPFGLITIYNLWWGLFNLLPVFPLDGSHILFSFLSSKWSNVKMFFERYGFLILLLLIFFGLDWMFQLAAIIYHLITGHLVL
jgi:Zn-dependent protease